MEAILKKLHKKDKELFNDIVLSLSAKDAVKSVILANELRRRRVLETKIEFALKMLYKIKIKMIHKTQSNPQQFKVSVC